MEPRIDFSLSPGHAAGRNLHQPDEASGGTDVNHPPPVLFRVWAGQWT